MQIDHCPYSFAYKIVFVKAARNRKDRTKVLWRSDSWTCQYIFILNYAMFL